MEQQTTTQQEPKRIRYGTYVNIPATKYNTFRKKASKKFKGKRGFIKLALEEAVKEWLKNN